MYAIYNYVENIHRKKKSWKDLHDKINSSTFFFLKHLNIFQFLYNEDKHCSVFVNRLRACTQTGKLVPELREEITYKNREM